MNPKFPASTRPPRQEHRSYTAPLWCSCVQQLPDIYRDCSAPFTLRLFQHRMTPFDDRSFQGSFKAWFKASCIVLLLGAAIHLPLIDACFEWNGKMWGGDDCKSIGLSCTECGCARCILCSDSNPPPSQPPPSYHHCHYLVEDGTDYPSNNIIGSCGSDKVMSDLRDTCTSNSQCVGFTTKLTTDGDWEGWCAKGTMRTKTSAWDHNAYTKYCSTDSPPTSGKCTRCLIN